MKWTRPRLSHLLLMPLLLLASRASAQTASLVKDINPGNASDAGLAPDGMWTFQGKVVFAADEPSTGRELWITNGNSSGTRLLADFNPGKNSSSPKVLGTARSLLFGIAFQQNDPGGTGSTSYLWRSDGTPEGTFLLPDPNFETFIPFTQDDGEPIDFQQVPLVLTETGIYFTGCQRDKCGLWRTDGTREGTTELRELGGTSFSNAPANLTLVGGQLFFTLYGQLWKSDGTPEGTVQVKTFAQGTPARLAALGNQLLFLAPDDGDELWVSDGTAAGTHALTHFAPPTPFRQTHFLKAFNGRIYFVADDVEHGAELWASDGTATGTVRVTDFGFNDPFRDDSFGGLYADGIESLGDHLIFWATDGLTGFQPWSVQGTPATTVALCPTCSFDSRSVRLLKLNGKLVFRAEDPLHGQEVWATDGTAAGTRILKDLCPGVCGGVDSELTLLSRGVFFRGPESPRTFSSPLWTTDGTPEGTRRFAAAEPVSYQFGLIPAAVLGKTILFGARGDGDSSDGPGELWTSDGTPAGTRKVAGTRRHGASSKIAELVAAGNQAFFTASDDGELHHVWRSDGTAAGTLASPDPFFFDFGESSRLTVSGDKLFLIQANYPFGDQLLRVGADGQTQVLTQLPQGRTIGRAVTYHGRPFFSVVRGSGTDAEIWTSDGTPQGTVKVITLTGLSEVNGLAVAGDALWFTSEATVWRSDGTQAGTRQVLALSSVFPDRAPEFVQLGSDVYFVMLKSNSDGYDYQIWKSDGTPGGTLLATDFPVSNDFRAFPAELTPFGGRLYFFADLPSRRRGLWSTDGTPAGTVPVKDFPLPDDDFFDPSPRHDLTVLGPWLVFTADDGVHGLELWRSDGTPDGTLLLRDIAAGPEGSDPAGFQAAAGQLFFTADDGLHGTELWRTDGTSAGTRLVQDIAPDGASSFPSGLTLVGDRLFFHADDGLTGDELWVLPLNGPGCQPSPAALCLSGGRYRVEAAWQVPDGGTGAGQAVPLSADTGYFWFFDPANVETVVKVLDGQQVNGHVWVFYGALSNVEYTLTVTDTQTGLTRRYFNPQGQFASVGDNRAFGPLGTHLTNLVATPTPRPEVTARIDAAAAIGTCVPGPGRLCLNGGRFSVQATWKANGQAGSGHAVGITGDTGYFWFFDPANVEAVVKVLDGTLVNGHFWVYYGALSNVEYTVTVTDTMTGRVKVYQNPQGRFASVGDGAAF